MTLEEMVFGLGKKGNPLKEHLSRREFLAGTAAAGIGLAVGEAKAGIADWKYIPIGIRNIPIKDSSRVPLQDIYISAIRGYSSPYYKRETAINAFMMRNGIAQQNVDPSYKLTEPGYYYIGYEMMMNPDVRELFTAEEDSILKQKNKALWYFREGIQNYFITWRYKTADNSTKVEDNMISAILEAAGRPQSDASAIKNMAIDSTKLTQMIMAGLEKRDMSQKRTASWAVTWLRNHYSHNKLNANVEYLKTIEVELRKYTGRIRTEEGGPYYFDPKHNI